MFSFVYHLCHIHAVIRENEIYHGFMWFSWHHWTWEEDIWIGRNLDLVDFCVCLVSHSKDQLWPLILCFIMLSYNQSCTWDILTWCLRILTIKIFHPKSVIYVLSKFVCFLRERENEISKASLLLCMLHRFWSKEFENSLSYDHDLINNSRYS